MLEGGDVPEQGSRGKRGSRRDANWGAAGRASRSGVPEGGRGIAEGRGRPGGLRSGMPEGRRVPERGAGGTKGSRSGVPGSVPALGGVGGAAEAGAVGLRQVLLLLPGGADGEDGLAVLVLHHLQRDRRVPALLLSAPKVDLLPLGHHHREVDVLAFPLHAVHRLHVGEVKLLHLGRRLGRQRLLRRRLLGGDEEQPLLGEDAALLLPELQEPVAPLLQHALLHRLAAALQHPSRMGRRGREPSPAAGAGVGGQPAPPDHSPPRSGSQPEGRDRPGPQEAERLPPGPRRGGAVRRGWGCGLFFFFFSVPSPFEGFFFFFFPSASFSPFPPRSDTQRKKRLLPPSSGDARRCRRRGRGAERLPGPLLLLLLLFKSDGRRKALGEGFIFS